MICTVSLFTSITSVVSRTVKLPNGQFASVTHIGTVRISESFLLTDVLCIPSFSFNLISVSKLIKMMHCCFIFLSNFCFIQHLTRWMTIGVGKEEGGLYYLLQDLVSVFPFHSTSNNAVINSVVLLSNSVLFNTVVPSVLSNNVVSFEFSDQSVANSIWHYRLGHLSDIPLKMLSSVIPHFTHESNKSCSICPLAKQHKLSFPHSEHISQHSFDLIHCDLWGPFSTKSISGSSYFLTIIDDHYHFIWIHLLQHKSQTITHIHNFFTMVETQFHSKIKCLRSDNGVEFNMADFYSSKGTFHQLSCVEIPQQNSIVERKH